ncbi:MAG: hypothetical protein BGO34_15535 [Bacteroidia bacterium 44-10]|nr:MAG: hypothetical protein BGO34_15535 [Bacteroidia bacterium 44-10]
MKTRIALVLTMALLFLLIGVGCEEDNKLNSSEGQTEERSETRHTEKLAWDYPVKPGTEEWNKIQSSQEMLNACQIPERVLTSLSTKDLAELCLSYPLLGDMLFSNTSIQDGFNFISSTFNGFQELFKRKDAGIELLKQYEQFNLDSFKKNKGITITNVFYDLCIDIVMGQHLILSQLNTEEKNKLIEIALKNLKKKQDDMDSPFRQKTTAVILSRLLIKENVSLSTNDKFLQLNDDYILMDNQFINYIQKEAEAFIK